MKAQTVPDTCGLVPGIHALIASPIKDVDGRNKSGHDVDRVSITTTRGMRPKPT